ncbi:MAG: hypothetical protein A2144_10680 [Chloroflexi bacterium RBG_16_50_9]|nr:MAG: hypothetical protein A2144_10680 [Chloroflexi bacterium RBG_16_50_9]
MGKLNHQTLGKQDTSIQTEKFFISIGGIGCAIISHDVRFLDLLRTRYQWFQSSGPAAYEILVRLAPIDEFDLEMTSQPFYPLVRKMTSGDNYIIRRVDNPFVAVVNTSSRKVLVKMWNSQYCFDSFLRMLFTLILSDEEGLLLQASAVSDNGRATVFFGPPGSGKTMATRLYAGRKILTDGMVIIKPHNGGFRVYGTPFGGDFTFGRSNARAELAGLYLLKKDTKNSLVPLDSTQAVENLYKCALIFGDDHKMSSRIRHTCGSLVETIPVYELHFSPAPSFWQEVNVRI